MQYYQNLSKNMQVSFNFLFIADMNHIIIVVTIDLIEFLRKIEK